MRQRLTHLCPIEPDPTIVDLILSGSRIQARIPASPESVEAMQKSSDGRRLAFPGFVNAHTHLPMVLFRGLADDVPLHSWLHDHIWPLERRLSPEDVYWCTLLALSEGIRSGTTTFADMYFHCDAIARAVEESGVRALLSYGMVASSLETGGAKEIRRAAQLIRTWDRQANGRIRVALAPHAVYTCGEDVWRLSIETAQALNVPIHTHLSETRSEVDDWKARTGMSPVQFLHHLGAFSVPTLAAHCVHVSAEDVALLADSHVTVAHCPKSNAKLGSGIAPVPQMQAAGVRIALGTDGAASNNRLDMLEELRAAWILHRARSEDAAVLPADRLLDIAVCGGRPVLTLDPCGLHEGAPADVVILQQDMMNPAPSPVTGAGTLAYTAVASDVTDVYVDGQPLLQRGELQTIDEDRVRYEVRHRLHRIRDT
jgi:5-methylthioadenosine/S-adenosylhomocysteine deaminase